VRRHLLLHLEPTEMRDLDLVTLLDCFAGPIQLVVLAEEDSSVVPLALRLVP
jgi:hypothetical protein